MKPWGANRLSIVAAKTKQQGFTLVELVAVIVILGILSVSAVPRFVNLSTDARIASLRAMEGAVKGSADLIFAKAAAEGKTQGEQRLQVDNVEIRLYGGYPIADWIYGIRYMITQDDVWYNDAGEVCVHDWCGRGNQLQIPSKQASTVSPGMVGKIFLRTFAWEDECGVYYLNHADGRPPEIGIETADC